MMWDILIKGVVAGAILSGTSLLYATLGEIIVERAGIVNLGVEGLLLVGASVSFVTAAVTGNAGTGVVVAALFAGLFTLIFGYVVIHRKANQLASGLALMFLGIGVSALLGKAYVGVPIQGLRKIRIPLLSDLPLFAGTTLLKYDILVYLAVPAAVLVWWLLFRTGWGLSLRAVGESPTTAFAAGKRPVLLRYQALVLGGALCGIGGAHLSLSLARTWSEGMTAGRGFIAIALVIFSKWNPLRAIAGALIFGGAEALQLQLQVRGVGISPFLLDMAPYVLTLLVLLVWGGASRQAAPAALGTAYRGRE